MVVCRVKFILINKETNVRSSYESMSRSDAEDHQYLKFKQNLNKNMKIKKPPAWGGCGKEQAMVARLVSPM